MNKRRWANLIIWILCCILFVRYFNHNFIIIRKRQPQEPIELARNLGFLVEEIIENWTIRVLDDEEISRIISYPKPKAMYRIGYTGEKGRGFEVFDKSREAVYLCEV